MKCIECACCDEEKMKCFPKSLDCEREYNLTEEDLRMEKVCDFARKRGEPIVNYYELRSIDGAVVVCTKTEINLLDSADRVAFLAELVKRGELEKVCARKVAKVYELTEEEYLRLRN